MDSGAADWHRCMQLFVRRSLSFLALCCLVLGVLAVPAASEDKGDPSQEQANKTSTPNQEADPTPPSAAAPKTPASTPGTAAPPNPTKPVEPNTGTTARAEPTSDSGPAESAPDQDKPAVDPAADGDGGSEEDNKSNSGRGGYRNQPPFEPDEVDPELVAAAESRLVEAKAAASAAEQRSEAMQLAVTELQAKAEELDSESADLVKVASEKRSELSQRAINSFMNPTSGYPKSVFDMGEVSDLMVRRHMLNFVAERDQTLIEEYEELQETLFGDSAKLVEESSELLAQRDQAVASVADANAEVAEAQLAVATFQAAGECFVPNAVFPVLQPYDLPLINSYGFARSTGGGHWHEGIDIFAPIGTPLVASETGVISSVGVASLGGTRLWITGDSGTRWYYAHLSGYAPNIRDGQVVQAGDVIGYVGDTGSARGTDPHLHLEIRPPGIRVINPYPQLKALSDRDLAQADPTAETPPGDGNAVRELVTPEVNSAAQPAVAPQE